MNVRSVSIMDSICFEVMKNHPVVTEMVNSRFVYDDTNTTSGSYIAVLTPAIDGYYLKYSKATNESDTLFINHNQIKLGNNFDPLSIKIYSVTSGGKSYLAFLGKGESASGSGLQRTFYLLFDKSDMQKYFEFESRFGSALNLFDFEGDGILEYVKVTGTKNVNEYLLTVNTTKNDATRNEIGYMKLDYLLNDSFRIKENRLVY